MKFIFKSLLVILFCHFSTLALAQTVNVATEEEMQKNLDLIVNSLVSENYSEAFKILKSVSVVSEATFGLFLAQFESNRWNMTAQFGEPVGFEFHKKSTIAKKITQHQYLIFHEKAPIRWRFVVYKGSKGFNIAAFNFDGSALTWFD